MNDWKILQSGTQDGSPSAIPEPLCCTAASAIRAEPSVVLTSPQSSLSRSIRIAARPDTTFRYIATSSLVLDTTAPSNPRILLVQRAASDSYPNTWEPPGGGCGDTDETILHAARELREEARLEAARVIGHVGDPHTFTTSSRKPVCQFNSAEHVKTDGGAPLVAKLNAKEHQRFVWATEGEVITKKASNVGLDFVNADV
ncbi:NUDIX hydrolase domain-like protein [Nemania sp. FL0031]|nr:NUDIX hydrolase domain-like protein [Nemania sp. FL0031]